MRSVSRKSNKADASWRGKTKTRRTFTLSPESVELLDELRKSRTGRSGRSTSAVLDDILQRLRNEREKQKIEQAVAQYYDNLPEADADDEKAWGDFAFAQLAIEDE
ncbi:MAG TPA: hypothetical protein VIY69_07740 [Candidatus Acidoferrales bacterium]